MAKVKITGSAYDNNLHRYEIDLIAAYSPTHEKDMLTEAYEYIMGLNWISERDGGRVNLNQIVNIKIDTIEEIK